MVPAAFNTLLGLSGAALNNALDQVSGQPAAGMTAGATQTTNSFLGLVLNPFAGAPGGNGGAIGYAREFGAGVSPEAAAAYAAVTPKDLRPDTYSFDRTLEHLGAGLWRLQKHKSDTATGTPTPRQRPMASSPVSIIASMPA